MAIRRIGSIAVFLAAVGAAWGDSLVRTGPWRAWVDCPGGAIPFGLELAKGEGGWSATIINGPERIEVPEVALSDRVLTLSIDYFDSSIVATIEDGGTRLEGEWKKKSTADRWTRLRFHATVGRAPRFEPIAAGEQPVGDLARRWAIKFDQSDDLAVGVFELGAGNNVVATVMTTTGDYRFLAGTFEANRLRLSCFDGAHAFLFDAMMQSDGTLTGDFWSRDSWHERWTARPDPSAELPDAFSQTRWTGTVPLADLIFPDPDGRKHSLADPAYAGKARIIEIFGTWCPNCHDASKYLIELHRKYRDRGLSIVGLAFELSGDFSRDAKQVRRYAARVGVTYPILVAGVSDKKKASEAFPALDRIRSYPTTIFLHADGRVRAVHTGFTGPATGDEFQKLRRKFETIIEELLTESSE